MAEVGPMNSADAQPADEPMLTQEELLAGLERARGDVMDRTLGIFMDVLFRQVAVAEVAWYKQRLGIPAYDPAQYARIKQEALEVAETAGIDQAYAEKLFACLHDYSVASQESSQTQGLPEDD